MCSRNVLSSKTRSERAHLGSSGAATDAESRVLWRTLEATEPESVVESSPERRDAEPTDGEGRTLERCRLDGDCGLLVAGGRFCAPPARYAEMPWSRVLCEEDDMVSLLIAV